MSQFPQKSGFRQPGPISWRWISLLIVAASLLRFIHLSSDLWLDEIGTLVTYARLPLTQIVRTYGSMNQHLLYSLMARVSIQVLGESAWALRLPAALLGIAAVPALYYLARFLTSEREALLASAMLAFSYHHIWFSQDARGYSAMVFFTLLGTAFLIRGLQGDSWTCWAVYILAMTLGVVSLQNTAFVVLGQWICCLFLVNFKRTIRMHISVAAIAALSLLCHSLMLTEMIQFMLHAERTGLGFTKLSDLLPVISQGVTAGVGIVGLAAAGILGFAGWFSYWRQTRLMAGILVLPIALNFALLIILGIGVYPRSFLYELPFACLIAVRGASYLCRGPQGERMASIAVVCLIVVASVPLIRYYSLPKQDFSGALAYVRAHLENSDVVMGADLAGTCYQRYYFPGIVIVTASEQIREVQNTGRRAWVLYSFPREFQLRAPELFRYLRTALEPVAIFKGTLGGGDVYVARTR